MGFMAQQHKKAISCRWNVQRCVGVVPSFLLFLTHLKLVEVRQKYCFSIIGSCVIYKQNSREERVFGDN